MPIPTFTGLPPDPTFTDVVNKVNRLSQEITNLMLNLDSLNVVSLTADNIDAGTIDANVVTIRSDLTAGAYVQINGNGMVINNGSFNTFTADINGNVTMTSANIQSATGYPRVVMDPNTDLFGAYLDADDFISIEADYGGTPSLNFTQAGNLRGRLNTVLGYLEIYGASVLGINATSIIVTGQMNFDDFHDVLDVSSGQTLQTKLDAKATSGASTGSSGSHNHGIPNGTILMVSGGGTVTFTSASNHTHAQI